MATTAPAEPTPQRPAGGGAVRMLGRYQLMRLLGKSTQSMLWLAQDSRGDAEVMLAMPRRQPAGDAALVAWMQRVRRTTRLVHPQLAPVLDVGEHDRWPFIVYERGHLEAEDLHVPRVVDQQRERLQSAVGHAGLVREREAAQHLHAPFGDLDGRHALRGDPLGPADEFAALVDDVGPALEFADVDRAGQPGVVQAAGAAHRLLPGGGAVARLVARQGQ